MAGSPIEIHVNPSAKPVACHSPASIPLHWQEKVYQDLLRDEALNILEKVTHGEPTQWCDRMVLTTKHDNTPLRTVDLSPLNKFCKREIFASKTPNHLTHQIPGRTWKTATDACNGYHKVPLRKPTVILYEILYESQSSFYCLHRTIQYNEHRKIFCHLAIGTIAASMQSWQNMSERNIALTTLSSMTRSWKITAGAALNTLLLSDGPALSQPRQISNR